MSVRTQSEAGSLGAGAKTAVAFGGGGEWFVAWMLGYASALKDSGVDLAAADVTVGTSAGAIVGAAIKGGRLSELTATFEQMGANPAAANSALHITLGAPSQDRAQQVMGATTQINTLALQEIGRAAMAAHNSPADDYIDALDHLMGLSAWPTGHHTTATDCYTGEPLVVDGTTNDVTIAQAAAASSSLPGANGPTWLGDRLCMDGGVSHSSTHATLLRGADFVLIIGMFDFAANPPQHVNPAFGIAERIAPGTAEREASQLRTAGSAVHVAIANPDPQTNFMDPSTIPAAIAAGRRRGLADAPTIAQHWTPSS